VDRIPILVLNYNGKELLAECLPSIVVAAKRSRRECVVSVVDNGSTDDSLAYLAHFMPDVGVIRSENLGLASFNAISIQSTDRAMILLNNDIRLAENAIDPLVDALENHPDALFAAPLCWNREGTVYEGMRTRVRSRFGLVQGMCRVPGYETSIHQADLTASAGPVLAINRAKFVALGGYDPLYFPGRIEDLDLGYRAWLAGSRGYYVPESVAFHHGFATFEKTFGSAGCEKLAFRNTFLFVWKNLRGARLIAHAFWTPIRLAFAIATGRRAFVAGFFEALGRFRQAIDARRGVRDRFGAAWGENQEAFFARFRW
jgi:N-acetylglucosaminyl-diphospho-decaprenol L-rhamnosyltransferase